MNNKVHRIISSTINFLLILLWTYAAASKLADYETSRGEMLNQALPEWLEENLVWGVPMIELFAAAESVEAIGTRIDDFKYPLSIEKYGVDAYIVKVYEREHKQYPLYIGDQMYWMDNFDKTRRNRNGIKLPKGFLEINY
ncbi:MAG: MauE/DoxX family redox-associated membrane protein [Daejeonella sp.]|uniref:DUF6932 family protein n=1 Tax=Daejeonella sp. TaxID=2805397 RepID=UPI003C77E6DF